MNQQFLANMVGYIETTNNLLEKYASIQRQRDMETKEYYEKIAASVKVLVKQGFINPAYEEMVTNYLKTSPVKTAEFLGKVYDRNFKMGEPAGLNRSHDPMLEFLFS